MAQSIRNGARELQRLREESARCQRCPLFQHATQVVFGEGPPGAPLMLIGEQPGDREDRLGRPFVGPAGRVLEKALIEAGLERGAAYITKVVKHFKFEERGRRRLRRSTARPLP